MYDMIFRYLHNRHRSRIGMNNDVVNFRNGKTLNNPRIDN
jgi:hypothetical protein